MNLEFRLKRCLKKRKEFIIYAEALYNAVQNEIENEMAVKVSIDMGQERSYVKQTLSRPLKINRYPANFWPMIKIAQAIINIKNKKKALEKI